MLAVPMGLHTGERPRGLAGRYGARAGFRVAYVHLDDATLCEAAERVSAGHRRLAFLIENRRASAPLIHSLFTLTPTYGRRKPRVLRPHRLLELPDFYDLHINNSGFHTNILL